MSSIVAAEKQTTAIDILDRLSRDVTDPQAAMAIAKAAVDLQIQIDKHQWEIDARQAKVEFNEALKFIQKNLKCIPKRGWNPDTKSTFATSEDIDNEIQKLLDDYNMTLTFRPKESDKPDEVLIIGVLSLGPHTEEYPLPMPADGKGAKGGGVMSRTHATGSAITYAKRYLKNMIFDLRFKEKDDDGNAAGISNDEGCAWVDKISLCDTPEETMRVWGQAMAVAKNLKPIDYKAMTIFSDKRDARLKELKKQR